MISACLMSISKGATQWNEYSLTITAVIKIHNSKGTEPTLKEGIVL